MANASSPPRLSLQFLDGLRGLAALFVTLHHARLLLWEGYAGGYQKHPETYSPLMKFMALGMSIFKEGHAAVLFFFVLSGFAIHLSYAARIKKDAAAPFDYGNYLLRRARRIYPPFLLAVLVTYLLDRVGMAQGYAIYVQKTPYEVINNNFVPDHSLPTLLGNLAFLMRNVVPTWGMNTPLWSLSYEWWFYMVYPALFFLTRRSITLATATVVLLFIASFFGPLWQGLFLRPIFSYLLSWWLGALLADLYIGRFSLRFAFLTPLIVLLPLAHRLGRGSTIIVDTLMAFGFVGVLALCFHLSTTGKSLKLLEKLKPMGDFSYSLYVLHCPIFVLLSGFLMAHNQGNLPAHFGWAFLAVFVAVGVAYLAHLMVEKPFTRKK